MSSLETAVNSPLTSLRVPEICEGRELPICSAVPLVSLLVEGCAPLLTPLSNSEVVAGVVF